MYSPAVVYLLEDLSWIIKAWGGEQTECPLLKLLSSFLFSCDSQALIYFASCLCSKFRLIYCQKCVGKTVVE